MLKIKKDKEVIRSKKKPLKWEWVLLIAMIVLFSCFYYYTDLPFSSSAGIRLWNCLTEGNLSSFYDSWYGGVANSALPNGSAGGSYDIMIYVIFALYNFPLWVWEKITGLSFLLFYPLRVYTKGIIWLFSGVSAYFIYKIALLCKVPKENAIWAPVIFLSSGIFFAAEVTIGGYDIISVAFTLLGIYGYLKKDNKCFMASFAVAIATKLFAFWIFVPLLLLKEKKIWKLIVNGALSISLIVIPKIYFAVASKHRMIEQIQQMAVETSGDSASAATADVSGATAMVNDVIAHSDIVNNSLFPTDYTATYTFFSIKNLPLVFVGMFAIWICCYLIRRELKEREVIYLCGLVMGIFITTVKIHPYWGILLVPYLALIVVMNPLRIKDNLLLESLISIGYVINKAILYPWCFGMGQIERMVGPNYVFGYDRETSNPGGYGLERLVFKLSEKIGIEETNIAQMFSALFVVAIVMFFYYNWPSKVVESEQCIGETQGFRKGMVLRFLFALFVAILPMIGLLEYVSPFYWG